jgi:hypothetical protein
VNDVMLAAGGTTVSGFWRWQPAREATAATSNVR